MERHYYEEIYKEIVLFPFTEYRNKKTVMLKKILLLTLAIMTLSLPGFSQKQQDNPYGVEERYVELYSKALSCMDEPRCLEYYEQMWVMARKEGDVNAQCLALSIPVKYHFYHGTDKQFAEKLKELRRLARASKSDGIYYRCFITEIMYDVQHERTFRALNKVHDQLAEVKKRPNPYATFACNVAFGEVYQVRRDEVHARECYLKAIHAARDTPNNVDEANVYISLAKLTEAGDTTTRMQFLHTALSRSLTPTDSAGALMGMAYLYSNLRDRYKFRKVYNVYSNIIKREKLSEMRYDKWYKANEAFNLELCGKPEEANRIRKSIKDPMMRYLAVADFYRSNGQNEIALAFMDSLVMYMRSSQSTQNVADVAELNTAYEVDNLRREAEKAKEQFTHDFMVFALYFTLLIVAILIAWLVKNNRMSNKLKNLSEELRVARDEAVDASKMKDVFIQNMSHEVRTPLNAVTGFAQLLALPAEMFTDEERSEFGKHVQNNTNLLTMLIDDILNISDMESGNYKMAFSTYKVNEICRVAISAITYRVGSDIELKFTTDVDDNYEIETDARRVQQVLINYLTNAIKHTEAGYIHLHVSLTETPGMLTFSVADTGSGIPGSKSEDIFKRFEKLDAFKQGTGLGLNICRMISQKLHGRVYLDKTYPDNYEGVEHGARFVFVTPFKQTGLSQE